MSSDANQSETMHELIASLSRPEAYVHRQPLPAEVTLKQTHISLLFFAGDRVYKVKKPVDMGFLDYRELAARRHFCHEEVRLNRRLSPEIYLGVRCIVRDTSTNTLRIGNEDQHPAAANPDVVDYAVEMIRLPEGRMLAAMLARGEIDNATIAAIASRLADFHRTCPTGPGVDEHASPEAISTQVADTLRTLQRFIAAEGARGLFSQTLHTSLRTWLQRFLQTERPLLQARIAGSRIREGHGDLHAENICLLSETSPIPAKQRIVIYDCIEFTRRFRCRDVACEIAFLAMDLDARGYRAFADYLVRRYAEHTDDHELARLVPFYKAHLALVRSMVEALKSVGSEHAEAERAHAADRARRYALLAATYAIGPAMIMMCGLPGSGKSSAARAIAAPFEAAILRSDVIRKQLAGLAPTQNASHHSPHIYQPEHTIKTYTSMRERAMRKLAHGRTVIADGTFSTRALRKPFIEAASALSVPWLLVETRASDAEIKRRMQKRRGDRTEVSDADWQVYLSARERWQPPDEIPNHRRMLITMDDSLEDAAARAIDALLLQLPA